MICSKFFKDKTSMHPQQCIFGKEKYAVPDIHENSWLDFFAVAVAYTTTTMLIDWLEEGKGSDIDRCDRKPTYVGYFNNNNAKISRSYFPILLGQIRNLLRRPVTVWGCV